MTPTKSENCKSVHDMVLLHEERINETKKELKFHVDVLTEHSKDLDTKIDQILMKIMLANTLSVGLIAGIVKLMG